MTIKSAIKIEEIIKKHISIMDKYDKDQKIDLVVDEWGSWYGEEIGTKPRFLFQQNTIRDAMIAGATLNIFNNSLSHSLLFILNNIVLDALVASVA